MSMGTACKCQPRNLVVVQRKGNASAFNGYRWTPSAYSFIRCVSCGQGWRTKAAYVDALPDAEPDQRHAKSKESSGVVDKIREQFANPAFAIQKPDQWRGVLRPFDPVCIVTKEAHVPRENDPARCRNCGFFLEETQEENKSEKGVDF